MTFCTYKKHWSIYCDTFFLFLWFRGSCATVLSLIRVQKFLPDTHIHTDTLRGPRHGMWGHSNAENKFQDTPHWPQSAVPTACRPNSGRHLCPIRATRGPWCRKAWTKKKRNPQCSPQSHPALFNYRAHSINFMLLTQWEHIKVYWMKQHRSSISHWLVQTGIQANGGQSCSVGLFG